MTPSARHRGNTLTDVIRGRHTSAALEGIHRKPPSIGAQELRQTRRRGGRLRQRRHLQCLWRSSGLDRPGNRSRAATDSGRRVVPSRGGTDSADPLLNLFCAILTARSGCCERPIPPALVLANPGFLRPCRGFPSARITCSCKASTWLVRQTAMWGARRSHPGAFGRGLCPREPHRALARFAGRVSGFEYAASRRVFSDAREALSGLSPTQIIRHRAAYSRPVQ